MNLCSQEAGRRSYGKASIQISAYRWQNPSSEKHTKSRSSRVNLARESLAIKPTDRFRQKFQLEAASIS